MNDTTHIVSSFDRDLESVQAHIMKMGGLVEQSILDAAKALRERDEELSEKVRTSDKAIDALKRSSTRKPLASSHCVRQRRLTCALSCPS